MQHMINRCLRASDKYKCSMHHCGKSVDRAAPRMGPWEIPHPCFCYDEARAEMPEQEMWFRTFQCTLRSTQLCQSEPWKCPRAWLHTSKWGSRVVQAVSFTTVLGARWGLRVPILALGSHAHDPHPFQSPIGAPAAPAGAHPAQTSICREVSCQILADLPCTTPFFSPLSCRSAGAALRRDGKRANGR